MVVSLSILFIHEMHIVGAHHLDTVFTRQFEYHLVGPLLLRKRLSVGHDIGVGHLVPLYLQVVVVAEYTLIPLDGLACLGDVAVVDGTGHLARQARRAHDKPFVEVLQVVVVCARPGVEAIDP